MQKWNRAEPLPPLGPGVEEGPMTEGESCHQLQHVDAAAAVATKMTGDLNGAHRIASEIHRCPGALTARTESRPRGLNNGGMWAGVEAAHAAFGEHNQFASSMARGIREG